MKLLERTFLIFLMSTLAGCFAENQQDPSLQEEPRAFVYTHYTDQTELFVEFSALVVGRPSRFAAHFTRLKDFLPVKEGKVSVILAGGGQPTERFSVEVPAVAGIFIPIAEPKYAGQRNLTLELESAALHAVHDLGEIQVYKNLEDAIAAAGEEMEDGSAISFLKEQQWQVDFATNVVAKRDLERSVPATGTLRPAAGGEAYVTAPTSGHLATHGKRFPRAGMMVQRGQVLATLIARLGGAGDMAGLELNVRKARAHYQLARQEQKRLQGLLAAKAVAKRRAIEAQTKTRVARAELDAAGKRLEQYRRQSGDASSGVNLYAPISGTLAQVNVAAGSYVEEGQKLFYILDRNKSWLEVRVAEADVGRVGVPQGASFKVAGFDRYFQIRSGENGRLIQLGRVLDPVSRTLPVIFEIDHLDQRLPMGLFGPARIFTGEKLHGLAIPESAIIDDNGQDVVFVQSGGESFQRRIVRLGIRHNGYVQVLSGLTEGERVVTEGPYLVYLAASSPGEAAHGHAH